MVAGVHPDIRGLEVPDLELHPRAVLARLLLHHSVLVTEHGNDNVRGGSWGGYDDDGDGGSISFYHQLVKLVSGVQ